MGGVCLLITADLQTLRTGHAQPRFKVKVLKDPRGAYLTPRSVVHTALFTSLVLYMDFMFHASSTGVASTWIVWFHSCRVVLAVGFSYGRSLLQVSAVSVRVQALSLGGSAWLRLRSTLSPARVEARGEGPARGRPTLQRPQTCRLLPTNSFSLSLLSGVHDWESADLLPVPEPNQSQLCSCDSGAGRWVEVSKTLLELAPGEDTCVRAHGLFSLEQNKGSWPKHSPFKKKKSLNLSHKFLFFVDFWHFF